MVPAGSVGEVVVVVVEGSDADGVDDGSVGAVVDGIVVLSGMLGVVVLCGVVLGDRLVVVIVAWD